MPQLNVISPRPAMTGNARLRLARACPSADVAKMLYPISVVVYVVDGGFHAD